MRFGRFFRDGYIGQAVAGVGAGTITGMVLGRVMPQYAGIASIAAGFLAGGIVGGAANFLLQGGLRATGIGAMLGIGGGNSGGRVAL
ncbi:MAG: hypothetical protein OXR67_13215 [Chloroflexota bacterium]|nr:hypothetical protein [Chloroflexota bacterium]